MSKYSNQVWLKKWLSGDLTRVEEAELWKLAESDPFLADALAGLESQPEINHALHLSNIEVRLAERARQNRGESVIEMGHQQEAKVIPMGSWRRVAAIAALLVIGLTGMWFIGNMNNSLSTVAMEDNSTSTRATESMKVIEPVEKVSEEEMAEEEDAIIEEHENELIPKKQKEITNSSSNQTQTKPRKKTTTTQAKRTPPIAQSEKPIAQSDTEMAAAPPAIAPEPYDASSARIEAMPRRSIPSEETDAAITRSTINAVQGVVKDENGEPLIGASVVEKGTDNGTVTDFAGAFSFELEKEAADLEIKYTGFQSETVPVQSLTTPIDITLTQSNVTLDEVVVTEMAIPQSKANVATSASTIGKEDIRGSKKKKKTTAKPIRGFKKFEKYIKNNLQYPAAARAIGHFRTVSLRFQLDANGMPTNIVVTNPLPDDLGFEKEAIRLLKEGGQWIGNTRETISYEIPFSL